MNTKKTNEITDYKIHDAAQIFPMMSMYEFKQLQRDIENNGQQVPIMLHQGKVVDGRHRLRACAELGITPKFVEMPASNQPIEQVVVSINLHRRHLTESQKAMVAARIANLIVGGNQHTAGAVSQKKAADGLGISIDSVQRAKKVLNHGVPGLIDAVSSGKIDISNAARLAVLAKEDQTLLNFDDIKTIQQASKAIYKAKFEERRNARLTEIEVKRANNKVLNSGVDPYSVIYADPPWDYMGELAVGYPCMSVQEICDMPVDKIAAQDAVLFMWCSASILPQAIAVVNAWGFKLKTSAVWDKGSVGQGAYFRQSHEILILATRGNLPSVPYASRPASVLRYKRQGHSTKPKELYSIINDMYPKLNKIELFCRGQPHSGWTGWGNECTQLQAVTNNQQTATLMLA